MCIKWFICSAQLGIIKSRRSALMYLTKAFQYCMLIFFINPYIRYVGNIHFTVKSMYHILQKCEKFIIRILFMVTNDCSSRILRYTYCNCIARTCKGTFRTRSLKSLKVVKVIDKFLVDNLDKISARCARKCTFYREKYRGEMDF